jgi:hypothetical protein
MRTADQHTLAAIEGPSAGQHKGELAMTSAVVIADSAAYASITTNHHMIRKLGQAVRA